MSEHITAEERNGKKQHDLREKAEEFKLRAQEMEEQLTENLNNIMNSTAENLDKAAEKMHDTAEFFRSKNMNTIKTDLSHYVRKNPIQFFGGALIAGFLVGKILFRR